MDRIVSEANRLIEVRTLVEDGIKKSQDVLSRLEKGALSLDFCRGYLKRFLEAGTLSKNDLLDFYRAKNCEPNINPSTKKSCLWLIKFEI